VVHAAGRGGGRAVGQGGPAARHVDLEPDGRGGPPCSQRPVAASQEPQRGSAKGYSHSLVDTGATNGKFYDARQLADEIYAVVVNVASKCRCDPATPRLYAKPIGLDDGMVKHCGSRRARRPRRQFRQSCRALRGRQSRQHLRRASSRAAWRAQP